MTTPPDDPDLPARMRASAFIRDAERRMQQAWFRSASRWMDRVRPTVTGGGQVQPQNIGQHRAFWGQLMQEEVLPQSASLFARVRNRITQRAEPVTDPDAARFLNEAGNRLVRLPDEVYALIVREVEEGVARGESIPDITQRVNTVLTATGSERWPNRAVTVARTEVMAAVNAGAFAGAVRDAERRGDPAPFKVWLCVAPDTSVIASSVKSAARRHYVGPLVRITTTSGAAVSLTPEHPVLTGRGWLAAKLIDQSDHLFRVPVVDAPGAPDVQHVPSRIGDVVDTLMQAESAQVRTMPVGVDLDGDSVNGDIEVVRTDGRLTGYVESLISEDLGQLSLMDADRLAQSLCLSVRAPGQDVGRDAHACTCGANPSSFPRLDVGTLSRSAQDSSLALAADVHPRLSDDVVDGETGATDDTANGRSALAGLIEPDDVVSVDVCAFSGHVYDLTTDGGWYVANSLLLHNSTEDARTRESHREADKQRTLLTSPFIVGGEQLQFPGDPRGSAQEVINCRCTLLPVVLGETLDWTSRQEP